jgi:hypothetical protein
MRLTRWKLMAGVLGLSMCGLAALAEPACRSVGITRRADEPKPADPVEAAKPAVPPLPVAVPSPPPATEVPPAVIPLVEDKKPVPLPPPLPAIDPKPAEVVKPVALPPVNDPGLAPAVSPKMLEEVHKFQNPPVALPTLTDKGSEPVAPLAKPVAPTAPAPIDFPSPKVVDTAPLPKPAEPVPTPGIIITPGLTPAPSPLLPVVDTKIAPLPEPKKADPVPPPPVATERIAPVAGAAKKLKVMLHLSDEKPWFEVKDGDEVVLKVTADAVALEAAASGKTTSTLTATGGVTFRTLGGFGTCDELRVVPGTGEVVVTGKVAVTSNWGKAETTATADKMTFRLGGDAGKK